MNWNAGGWFGSQLGGTAWMLVAGALAAAIEPLSGLVVLGLFALPNVLGTLLWWRRTFSCYASMQVLVAAAGVCSLLAVAVLERSGVWGQIQTGGRVSAGASYWIICLAFAGVILMLYLRFGRHRT